MAAERIRCAASRTRGCAAAATLHNSHPNRVGPAPNGTVAAHNKQVRVQRPHRWAQDEDGTIRFPRTTRPENRQRLQRRPAPYRPRARSSTSRSRGRIATRSELQTVSFSLRDPHQPRLSAHEHNRNCEISSSSARVFPLINHFVDNLKAVRPASALA
jgi:hypothetical protein